MRIVKHLLALLALLLIPLANAQEESPGTSIVLEEDISFESLFEEYGCPVGIRDANRNLELNSAGLITAGQSIFIPNDTVLCALDYTGGIRFFDWEEYYRLHRYPNTTWEFAAFVNVCEEALDELNPYWRYQGFIPSVRIPLDTAPCFETLELAAGQTPHDLALELNICENLIWYYNNVEIYEESSETRSVYIPLERQPCYLDGQVLALEYYPNEPGYYIPAEIVELDEAMTLWAYALDAGYCYNDLEAANRGKAPYTPHQQEEIYIPEGARHCSYISDSFEDAPISMVELAYEYNVCLENLIAVNRGSDSWDVFEGNRQGIWIPKESPCYDENGLRIGQNERAVHQTSREDWLYGIAQEYQLCLADLYEANPLLATYPETDLPSILFIPDMPPCSDVREDGYIHHEMRDGEIYSLSDPSWTYRNVSLIYNVCELEIITANPQMYLNQPRNAYNAWGYDLAMPERGDILLVPGDARPCYDYYIPMTGIGHYRNYTNSFYPVLIQYICYAEEIDFNQDYTGHEPAISPVPMQADSYCYDRLANPYIILNNVRYALYPAFAEVYFFELAECFGSNAYEIIPVTYGELGVETDYPQGWVYWGVPNPSQDCPLVGSDIDAALSWLRQSRERSASGTLNEAGEYEVAFGDTLSSIGWRYGYLPEWIMAENQMPNDMIFIHQRLRLPKQPNLYQMAGYGGAAAGALALLFGASFALRLRAKGRKGKKKNEE